MLIFVYGTLKRGHGLNGYLAQSRFLGEAKTAPKYELVDLGAYPALLKADPGLAVHGEVWEVDELMLQLLDKIERSPWLYRREPIEVPGYEGVQAYFFQASRMITSGARRGYKWPFEGD